MVRQGAVIGGTADAVKFSFGTSSGFLRITSIVQAHSCVEDCTHMVVGQSWMLLSGDFAHRHLAVGDSERNSDVSTTTLLSRDSPSPEYSFPPRAFLFCGSLPLRQIKRRREFL